MLTYRQTPIEGLSFVDGEATIQDAIVRAYRMQDCLPCGYWGVRLCSHGHWMFGLSSKQSVLAHQHDNRPPHLYPELLPMLLRLSLET